MSQPSPRPTPVALPTTEEAPQRWLRLSAAPAPTAPDRGGATYALIQSGPAVPAHEVEDEDTEALEITLLWGSTVLHALHLAPLRGFVLGEAQPASTAASLFLPPEVLGRASLPIVVMEEGTWQLIVPSAAQGWLQTADGERRTLDACRGDAAPSTQVPGGVQVPLRHGLRAQLVLGAFSLQLSSVKAAKRRPRSLSAWLDRAFASSMTLTVLGSAALLAAMAYSAPPSGLTDDEGISREQLYLMQQYLDSAAQRELREQAREDVVAAPAAEQGGDAGTRARGAEGQLGKLHAPSANKRYAVTKLDDEPRLARDKALEEARSFGTIGLLASMNGGNPNAPTAFFGGPTSSGLHDFSAEGNMWGDALGESGGRGGLGLSSDGLGGGGLGEGIGLTDFGGLGNGLSQGPGGFGRSTRLQGTPHQPKAPKIGVGTTTVSGRIPAEVIQRIVRQNYGRFRQCYELGLARNPSLEGRVATRFVIGRDGAVSNVSNGGADLPDSGVVSCVIRSFYGLSFPAPEGGVVTVVYPISFQPG